MSTETSRPDEKPHSLNLSLPPELLEALEARAELAGETRDMALATLLRRALQVEVLRSPESED